MKYQVVKKEDASVITLEGRLDTVTSAEFSAFVDKVLDENPTNVEFDCEKLEYIASSGLRIFLSTFKKLKANHGNFVLLHIQPEVMNILQMTGFTNILSIKE